MLKRSTLSALLTALAILRGGGHVVKAEETSNNVLPRLQITQKVLHPVRPGMPFDLDICVRNVGDGAARSVHIFERLPKGAELLAAAPSPARQQDVLEWLLTALNPAEEQRIRLRLRVSEVPAADWSNRARVDYQCEVANDYAIHVHGPCVELDVAAPELVLRGDQLSLEVKVWNTGDQIARHLTLAAYMRGGLVHESGVELENELGDLGPGQVCTIPLTLDARQAGRSAVELRLSTEEAALDALTKLVTIEVRDAQVDLGIHGPTSVSAGWPCTYDFVFSNQGSETIPAGKLVVQMPGTFAFVRASGNAVREGNSQTVCWDLRACKPGETVTCVLSGIAQEKPGDAGCLKLIHNQNVIKEASWNLHVLAKGPESLAPSKDERDHNRRAP